MATERETQISDEELDKQDCAEKKCMYAGCDQDGPPIVITAIWNYYHQSCYDKRQKEIWG